MLGCNILFLSVAKPFPAFSKRPFKRYNRQLLKMLLKHPRPLWKVVIFQQGCSSTHIETYITPKKQYPGTKTKDKIPVI